MPNCEGDLQTILTTCRFRLRLSGSPCQLEFRTWSSNCAARMKIALGPVCVCSAKHVLSLLVCVWILTFAYSLKHDSHWQKDDDPQVLETCKVLSLRTRKARWLKCSWDSVLAMLVEGPALDIILNSGQGECYESWRRLGLEYDPRSRVRAAGSIMDILSHPFTSELVRSFRCKGLNARAQDVTSMMM